MVEKIVMAILKMILEWILDPENIAKVKKYIVDFINERAAKEGKDFWDYLKELLDPILAKK